MPACVSGCSDLISPNRGFRAGYFLPTIFERDLSKEAEAGYRLHEVTCKTRKMEPIDGPVREPGPPSVKIS